MKLEYVVIADNHCWGAGKSLRKALSNACLHENTRLSFFEHVADRAELADRWADWLEYGRGDWAHTGWHDPVRCFIYPLDREQWASWRVCDITGGLSATPSDESVTGSEASARLRELVIRAEWRNGELRPVESFDEAES